MIQVASTAEKQDRESLEADVDAELAGLNAYLESIGLTPIGSNKRDHLGKMEWAMVKTYLMAKLEGKIP